MPGHSAVYYCDWLTMLITVDCFWDMKEFEYIRKEGMKGGSKEKEMFSFINKMTCIYLKPF